MNRRVTVLASHLPGEGHFESERHFVVPLLCRLEHPTDYWLGLSRYWDSDDTLINVEHDMDVTDEHMDALLDCPHPLCTWAYACHWVSTGKPHDVIAAGTGDRRGNGSPDYLQGREEWATWSAIGLVKIEARSRTAWLRCEPWQFLELAVEDAVKRPWHVHWPEVTHHHW